MTGRIASVLLRLCARALPEWLRHDAGREIVDVASWRVARERGPMRFFRLAAECAGILRAAVAARHPDMWAQRTAPHVVDTEETKAMRAMPPLHRILPRGSDLRPVARTLVRQWRFSAGVILTLGLGVGLGLPVLGLADTFFLRPPAGVTEPDRVVRLVLRGVSKTIGTYYTDGLTGLDYSVLRERSTTLSHVGAWLNMSASLGRGATARTIRTIYATPSYFTALGVRPAFGRFYTDAEDSDGNGDPPVVISHQFWQRELLGSPEAIGRRLRIGSLEYTVVGITPRAFNGLNFGAVDAWLPLHVAAPEFQGRNPELWTTDHSAWLRIVARLAPGATLEQSAAEVALLYRTSGVRTRDKELKGTLLWDPVQPGRSIIPNRTAKLALWLSLGGGLLLLLIAANLTSLFRVRLAAMARQTAIRLAVGGAWPDLMRGLLTEAFLLAIAAALVGMSISIPATHVTRTLLFPRVEFALGALDPRIVVIAFALAFGIGAIVAVFATLRAAQADPAELLRAGASTDIRRPAFGLRSPLLALQAMVFTMLLAGAAAFTVSLRRATAVDFGFDESRLIAVRLSLAAGTPVTRVRELIERARDLAVQMPQVESATLSYMEPWYNNNQLPIAVPGSTIVPPYTMFDFGTPEYLKTFGARLKSGRWISADDRVGSTAVIVINEALEKVFWPGESSLGKCIRVGEDSMPCRTIVGVVRNFKVTGGADDPDVPVYWIPYAQSQWGWPTLFVRSREGISPDALLPALRGAVQGLDPDLQAASVRPVSRNIEWMTTPLRLGASVFIAFGLLAAIVGSIGLLSVLSYIVVEQRRTHAVKLALGATPRLVGASVVRFSVLTTAIGIAAGLLALLPLSRMIDPVLFHTRVADPLSLLAVAALGVALALLAAAPPVRAIFRMQVMTTLREQ